MLCAICNRHPESTAETIYVYSHRLGGEVRVPACDLCLAHFNGSAVIAERIVNACDAKHAPYPWGKEATDAG